VSEHEQLVELCRRLGASAQQAEAMARQLAKRADQLAAERGVTRVDAMKYLLEVVVKGRAGEALPQFPRSSPPAT
jgi:hypothetical protein